MYPSLRTIQPITIAALHLDTGAAIERSLGGLNAITRSVIDANRLAVITPAALGLVDAVRAADLAIGYRLDTLALPGPLLTLPTFPTLSTIGDSTDDDDNTAD